MLSLLGQAHFKGSCLPLNFLDQQSLHLAILRITLEPYKKWQRLGLFIRLIKAESFEIWECLCFKSSPGALMRNQIWETLICDMTNLDSILKSRDITLSTKVCLVKAMVFPFPVVMYGCESWTIKKDECWRIDAFELWCWRRLLRVFWTARRSNQSILKEISPGCSLERLMLKLKLQYFGHMMQRKNWQLRKDPDAGQDWRQEKGTTGYEMAGWHHQLNGYEFEQALGVGDGQGSLACCRSWGCKESDTTEWLNLNWICDNQASHRVCPCDELQPLSD